MRELTRHVVRRWRELLDRPMASIGSRGDFFASLYYTFFSTAFRREQRSVLSGRVRYAHDLVHPCGSAVLLRRNIHRLEKGLLMRPRRIPFGLDYVGETVAGYARAMANPDESTRVHDQELQWAHDVLHEYFEAMQAQPEVFPLRQEFLRLQLPSQHPGPPFTPYRRDPANGLPVTYDELLALGRRRRSVRWFEQRPVPREMIDRALAVAALSPSACNRQPFVFRVFDNAELVRRILEVPYGAHGYGHNVPAVAVIVGQQRSFCAECDRHLIYIDGSLAAMSFLFGLEAQGLASCCINWPDLARKERQMAKLLRLEPDARVVLLIAFGFPDGDGLVASSCKKPLGQLRRYNFE